MKQVFDPFAYRDLLIREDRIGQRIEGAVAGIAVIPDHRAFIVSVSFDPVRSAKGTVLHFDRVDELYLFFRSDPVFGVIPFMDGGRDQLLGKTLITGIIPGKITQRSAPVTGLI